MLRARTVLLSCECEKILQKQDHQQTIPLSAHLLCIAVWCSGLPLDETSITILEVVCSWSTNCHNVVCQLICIRGRKCEFLIKCMQISVGALQKGAPNGIHWSSGHYLFMLRFRTAKIRRWWSPICNYLCHQLLQHTFVVCAGWWVQTPVGHPVSPHSSWTSSLLQEQSDRVTLQDGRDQKHNTMSQVEVITIIKLEAQIY